MADVHVCGSRPVSRRIITRVCLDCGRRSRFVCVYYEWYGPSMTCLSCGRHWEDGEWMPLPFTRNARQKSIESAKRAYRRAQGG